jgi:integrase
MVEMKRNYLTQLKIKNAKPGHHCDGHGLYLQVSGAGAKSWVFRFMLLGRQREMGLGSIDTYTLAEARDKAREYRKMVLEGIDPIEARLKRREEIRAEAAAQITFKRACEEYVATHRDGWRNPRHAKQWQNSLRDHASRLFDRPVEAITAAVITETLAPIWTTTSVTAARVKQRIERVCAWVKAGKPLPTMATAKNVKHLAALHYTEVPDFMCKLRSLDTLTARTLEFTILTAARSGEVVGAKWSEINLDTGTWTIPAGRMKAGKEHEVPLSGRALEILHSVPRQKEEIFGVDRGNVLRTLRKLRSGVTVHGFRSSFRDWAGERSVFPREVIEHALAHGIVDKTERAYRRETALPKRRQLMEAWAKYLSTPVVAGEVVPLRKST